MNTAKNATVHSDDDIVESPEETVDMLRRAIGLATDAVAHANGLRDKWVKEVGSLSCKSPSSCNEEEQKSTLKRLMEAKDCAGQWVQAVSFALTMGHRAELMVNRMPLLGEPVERETLAAVKARIKGLKSIWEQTFSHVEQVSQFTTDAEAQWERATTIPSKGVRKILDLDSKSAYQAIWKIYQIAGWYTGWHTNWEGKWGYQDQFRRDLFSFQFHLDYFHIPYETKDVLLQIEARYYSFHSSPCAVDHPEIRKEEATEDVKRAILTADEVIGQMIRVTDTWPAQMIGPRIRDNGLATLTDVMDLPYDWASKWNQVITRAGKVIWQIVQTVEVLATVDENNTSTRYWIRIRDEAAKMFQSWYPYMYGIEKLYHHIAKVRDGIIRSNRSWQSLLTTRENKPFKVSYQYDFSPIAEEEREIIEAMLYSRYLFHWMFWDNMANKYNQNRFSQMGDDWIRFHAELLAPGTPSSLLFDTQNQENLPSPSLHFIENSPSLNIQQEARRWVKITIPQVNQRIIRAIGFMKKWPKQKEVSLLKANESLEILMDVKSMVLDWSQAMSTARLAIQEMSDALQVLSIIKKNDKNEKQARSILEFWDNCIELITSLSKNITHAEDSWQALVTPKETSATDFSLNSTSDSETKTRVEPSTKIHVNICISLDPDPVNHTWVWQQKNSDLITAEEHQAINGTRGAVDSARRLWWHNYNYNCHDYWNTVHYSYLTGQSIDNNRPTIDADGKITQTTRSSWQKPCISYDWMLLRTELLDL